MLHHTRWMEHEQARFWAEPCTKEEGMQQSGKQKGNAVNEAEKDFTQWSTLQTLAHENMNNHKTISFLVRKNTKIIVAQLVVFLVRHRCK
jgi:hypothetical protein